MLSCWDIEIKTSADNITLPVQQRWLAWNLMRFVAKYYQWFQTTSQVPRHLINVLCSSFSFVLCLQYGYGGYGGGYVSLQ